MIYVKRPLHESHRHPHILLHKQINRSKRPTQLQQLDQETSELSTRIYFYLWLIFIRTSDNGFHSFDSMRLSFGLSTERIGNFCRLAFFLLLFVLRASEWKNYTFAQSISLIQLRCDSLSFVWCALCILVLLWFFCRNLLAAISQCGNWVRRETKICTKQLSSHQTPATANRFFCFWFCTTVIVFGALFIVLSSKHPKCWSMHFSTQLWISNCLDKFYT